jgi:ribosomal protein S18 acetylase RimI-like enzyme
MAPKPEPGRIDIVGYENRFAADFRRLNAAWLEGYGLLEPADAKYLDTPRETILAAGGQIFFAVKDGVVLGTCAVLRVDPGVVELAKLAVDPAAQGRGIGRRLTLSALEHARSLGAEKVVLVTNHKLTSAIRLYESLGFAHAPVPTDTCYATADVYMELPLREAPMAPTPEPSRIDIVGYADRFAADFRRLNVAWLKGNGLWEEVHAKSLDAPRETILAAGGQIFFAVADGVVVGTCAVLRVGPGVVELAKLAVAPAAQGRGLGRRLTLAALEHARSLGAEKVVLVTNSRLTPAIRLYESLGFVHVPVPKDSYAAADVCMEFNLVPPP